MPEARRLRVNIIPDGVLAVGEKAVLREAAAGLNLIHGTYNASIVSESRRIRRTMGIMEKMRNEINVIANLKMPMMNLAARVRLPTMS